MPPSPLRHSGGHWESPNSPRPKRQILHGVAAKPLSPTRPGALLIPEAARRARPRTTASASFRAGSPQHSPSRSDREKARRSLEDWVQEQNQLQPPRPQPPPPPRPPGLSGAGLKRFERALTRAVGQQRAQCLDGQWGAAASMLEQVTGIATVWGDAECESTRCAVAETLGVDPSGPLSPKTGPPRLTALTAEGVSATCVALGTLLDALCAFAPRLAGLARLTMRRVFAAVYVVPPDLPKAAKMGGDANWDAAEALSKAQPWFASEAPGCTTSRRESVAAFGHRASLPQRQVTQDVLMSGLFSPVSTRGAARFPGQERRDIFSGVNGLIEEAVSALVASGSQDPCRFFAEHFTDRHASSRVDLDSMCIPVTDTAAGYLSRPLALKEARQRAAYAASIVPYLTAASMFGRFDNSRPPPEDAEPGSVVSFNAASLHRRRAYPVQKRLAWTFLDQLGRIQVRGNGTRSWDRDPKRDVVYHVPLVNLKVPISDWLDDDREIVLNAEKVDMHAGECADDDLYQKFFPGVPGPSALDIYGPGEFRMRRSEVRLLEQTTRVVMTGHLTSRFFCELAKLTTDPQYAQFFSIFRSIALGQMGRPSTVSHLASVYEAKYEAEAVKVAAAEEERAQLVGEICGVPSDLERTKSMDRSQILDKGQLLDRLGRHDWDLHQHRLWRDSAKASLDTLRRTKDTAAIAGKLQTWLHSVTRSFRDYGFESRVAAQHAISSSLVELATHVCLSQRGYFFVDGKDGAQNQLVQKPPEPVTFLCATGLDFNTPSTTMLEAQKYFRRATETDIGATSEARAMSGWKGLREGAEHVLIERIKQIYIAVFTSCQHHRVRNPSMLAMGCGAFLLNVSAADRQKVREVYFKAQFELLSQRDWGFETYYLNAADHTQLARDVLEAGVRSGDYNDPQQGRFLRCHVVVHNRDTKFLAVELSKHRMGAAVLNPSDCATLMQGVVGGRWETGRCGYYGGEEDTVATGTAILAHSGISNTLVNIGRCICVDQPTQRLAVAVRPSSQPRVSTVPEPFSPSASRAARLGSTANLGSNLGPRQQLVRHLSNLSVGRPSPNKAA
eukprot:TRINITY_DN1442_c2_g1_i1.p1 TRINITY_DN1442_c2_g1~~TRINITY_DN1442_c2_g1_i1.p1  ORF type:complete len:1097 (+),score=303.99 TRINITY_DN1442_c2_g1_i1:82-3291(+)